MQAMDAFASRKRRREPSPRLGDDTLPADNYAQQVTPVVDDDDGDGGDKGGEEEEEEEGAESTELKLAILASLAPTESQEHLLELLVKAQGSVEKVLSSLSNRTEGILSPRNKSGSISLQSSLHFTTSSGGSLPRSSNAARPLTRKGRTLHLFTAADIATHTPCSIIHNFLPAEAATKLLKELLAESPTFHRATFKLFDKIVQSPHSSGFYVNSLEELERQKGEYLYNGSHLSDVREILPQMRQVSGMVQEAVNKEVTIRIRVQYPEGQKLTYQCPDEWVPNAAFVNCYDGGAESVGWHSDQLTYLGPRAIIGTLSLGVAREFRVRKIVGRDKEIDSTHAKSKDGPGQTRADAEGQISIHLPHNSLLVMHAEMQEEWKHSIHPATTVAPHSIAGNKRISITYRWYRESFHPRYTPKCRCGMATVLKCVQKRRENRGRYMWMCQAGGIPDKQSCGFFEWATFTDDGEPVWNQQI